MAYLHLSQYKNDIKHVGQQHCCCVRITGLCTVNWMEEWWSQIFPQEPIKLNLEQSSGVIVVFPPVLCSIN